MGKGKQLSEEEKVTICVLKAEGYSGRAIAKKLNRCKSTVNVYLANKETYGKNMKGGTHRATTIRERRAIIREASNSTESAVKIAGKVGCSASISTVRRVIKSSPIIKRLKIKKKATTETTT